MSVVIILGLRYFYNIMVAVVSITNRYGIRIEECHRNQLNKTKLRDAIYVITFTVRVV